MADTNWIEPRRGFPEIDSGVESYLEDVGNRPPSCYRYGFATLPQLKALLDERLGDQLGKREQLEVAKHAFRNKPREQYEIAVEDGRNVVDFIYAL